MTDADGSTRYRFPASRRLHGRRAFAAVFGARVRRVTGPLTVFSRPNDLGHWRLGLSVSRRVGIAVRRNRIKRLVREAFRLNQAGWAAGYDLVVVVHRHEPLMLAEYERLLAGAAGALHRAWGKRGAAGDGK